MHPCRSIPFSPASSRAWQSSSYGPEAPWGGWWAVCTRNRLCVLCSTSQGGQDRWVEDPFYHCQRAVLNKLLPWGVLSAVPALLCQGELPYPVEQGDGCLQKISICCSVTAQVRLMQRDEAFPFCLSPCPAGAMGAAHPPASSLGLPMGPPKALPLRVLLCHGGLRRWRSPLLGGYRNKVRAQTPRGFLPESSSWGHHPSAFFPLPWRGMGLHGQDAIQGLALACWEGWCSVPVRVRVSSGSINRLIDVVFCPVSKHQQIKNEKKKIGRWKAPWYFREDRAARWEEWRSRIWNPPGDN